VHCRSAALLYFLPGYRVISDLVQERILGRVDSGTANGSCAAVCASKHSITVVARRSHCNSAAARLRTFSVLITGRYQSSLAFVLIEVIVPLRLARIANNKAGRQQTDCHVTA
jgi:hypothetical protein